MNQYALRKNFTAFFSDSFKTLRGKLAFKTKETDWLHTEEPIIILISIHSAIHEGPSGDLKMNALISIIRDHVRNRVTLLLSEKAHLHLESLKWQSQEEAFEQCLKQAHQLHKRYLPYFENCHVAYWNSYICQDKTYNLAKNKIKDLYQKDPIFQKYVLEDVKKTYTSFRAQEYPCKDLFMEKAILDLLEQCAALYVLSDKGYKFIFYPGRSYLSTDYINRSLIPKKKQISWIDVFLSIEQKTILKKANSSAA